MVGQKPRVSYDQRRWHSRVTGTLTDIPPISEGVETMIGPLSFLGNDNRAPRAQ